MEKKRRKIAVGSVKRTTTNIVGKTASNPVIKICVTMIFLLETKLSKIVSRIFHASNANGEKRFFNHINNT